MAVILLTALLASIGCQSYMTYPHRFSTAEEASEGLAVDRES